MPPMTSSSESRQPTMPSQGGLMGHGFVYRRAKDTDVRLTWERAKNRAAATPSTAPSYQPKA